MFNEVLQDYLDVTNLDTLREHEKHEAHGAEEHDLENLSPEEKQRMHDAYAEMGRKGGHKGGVTRAVQMAHEGPSKEGKK